MAGCERCVVTNDVDELGSDMRSEHLGGDLAVTGIAEDLSDVVTQRGQDQLVICTGLLGASGHLERVVELTDVASIGDVREAHQASPHTLGSSAFAVESVHG
jgi:hypothetical protein